MGGENNHASVVVSRHQLLQHLPALADRKLPLVWIERRHRRGLYFTPRRIERYRDGEVPGRKAERGVEPDVVHGARHRLEPNYRRPRLLQPFDSSRDDHLADTLPLIIGMHGERTHPAFDARAMDHVERRDAVARVAPDHRPILSVGDGKLPYRGIEVRHPYANHPVFAVALGKRFAEDSVERGDFADADTLWRLRYPGVPPVA